MKYENWLTISELHLPSLLLHWGGYKLLGRKPQFTNISGRRWLIRPNPIPVIKIHQIILTLTLIMYTTGASNNNLGGKKSLLIKYN